MRKTKKVLAFFLSIMFIFAFATLPCYAENSIEIMSRWNNVGSVETALNFYDNEGVASASVTKGNIATSLAGVLTVYEYYDGEWNDVYSTSKTTTRNTLFLSLEFEGISGREYKAELVVTAYNGTTVMEEITDVKYATCP